MAELIFGIVLGVYIALFINALWPSFVLHVACKPFIWLIGVIKKLASSLDNKIEEKTKDNKSE